LSYLPAANLFATIDTPSCASAARAVFFAVNGCGSINSQKPRRDYIAGYR